MGSYFMEKLSHLPHVKEVRGQGLLVGVEFDDSISGVEAKHLRYTGSSNRGILENLRKLSKKGADIWIRIPEAVSISVCPYSTAAVIFIHLRMNGCRN